MKPLVSIIIPTYNRANLICETINSIIAQTYFNWECIIVDDGSTDDTSDIINKYVKEDKRFQYYQRPVKKIKGPSSCRNFGIEKANGEFIIFLDSDDLFTKNCIENRIAFAQFNLEFDLWIFKTMVFDIDPEKGYQIFNTILDDYSDKIYLKLFFEGYHPFCVLSPLWRTEKIKKIGGFDERLMVAEDPDLHIRAFLNGLKSLTCNSKEYDTLYRMDVKEKLKSKNDKNLIKKCHNSLYIIFKKFLKNHKESIQYYGFKFFTDDLLQNGSSYNIIRFYILYIRFNILSIKQFFLIPVLILYKMLKLETINGFGFYSLKKAVFKN